MMGSATIASSTAYSVLCKTLEAISSCPDLAIVWPENDRLDHIAAGFIARSRQGIMDPGVRAVDGLFIRTHKPRVNEHSAPPWFYSGHKKGFGLNLQAICNAARTSSQQGAFLVQVVPTIGQPGTCQTSNPTLLMSTTLSVILPTHPRTVFLRHTRELVSVTTKIHSTFSTHKQG
ncbi:unnamed protein product [Discosporangium mesarthrocarpum]